MPKDPKEALSEFKEAVKELATAGDKVLLAWERLDRADSDLSAAVARDYPFHISFDELVANMHGWKVTLKMMVKRGWPGPREWLPPNPKR
jgi:hypothetical protein